MIEQQPRRIGLYGRGLLLHHLRVFRVDPWEEVEPILGAVRGLRRRQHRGFVGHLAEANLPQWQRHMGDGAPDIHRNTAENPGDQHPHCHGCPPPWSGQISLSARPWGVGRQLTFRNNSVAEIRGRA